MESSLWVSEASTAYYSTQRAALGPLCNVQRVRHDKSVKDAGSMVPGQLKEAPPIVVFSRQRAGRIIAAVKAVSDECIPSGTAFWCIVRKSHP